MKRLFPRLWSSVASVVVATVVLTGGGTLADIATGHLPAAFAQDPGSAPPTGQTRGRMGKILMSLDLSDAQKTQIRAIIADARKHNATVTEREEKRANMRAAYMKVDTVLTPAQRTELHAKLDALRAGQAEPAK